MAAKIAAPAADAVTDVTIDGKMQVKAVLEEMKEFLRSEGEKRCGKSLWPFDIAFELYTSYGYSVFVKHVRKGVLTGEADYGKNGIMAIAEVYNYVVGHAEADEFLEKRMRYGGIVLAPQYRSDELALPMVMLTPEAGYGVLQQAAVIVTASIEVDDREISFSQISKVTVHLLGGEESEKEAQANAQIDSSLTALHTKAKALADRAPETAHSDGKSAFYRLRLAEISAVPGASMHLGFYEIHNLDARNRTQPSEFAYAFDLTTGARQSAAAGGEREDGAADVSGLGIDDLLDAQGFIQREGVTIYGEGTRLGLRAQGTVTSVLALYHPVDGYGVSGAVVAFATSLTDAAIWLPDVEAGSFEIT